MARLDVLVPFYGDPGRLREAVGSVLAQSSPDWRLLVVDDARPGPSVRPWLEKLGDPRIEYHRNPANLGVNGNFRRCLELATAPHVTFLGDDDLLAERYVEVVLAAADETGAAMVQPGVRVVDGAGRETHPLGDRVKTALRPRVTRTTVLTGEPLARSLMRGNWAYFPSLCWRRAAVARHGFVADLQVALDLRLIVDLVADGESMALVPEVCFAYRRHAASASAVAARAVDRFDEEAAVMDDAARRFTDLGWGSAATAARRRVTSRLHALSLLPGALRSDERGAASRLVGHVLAHGSR